MIKREGEGRCRRGKGKEIERRGDREKGARGNRRREEIGRGRKGGGKRARGYRLERKGRNGTKNGKER